MKFSDLMKFKVWAEFNGPEARKFHARASELGLDSEIVPLNGRLTPREGFVFFTVAEDQSTEIFRGVWIPDEILKKWKRQIEDHMTIRRFSGKTKNQTIRFPHDLWYQIQMLQANERIPNTQQFVIKCVTAGVAKAVQEYEAIKCAGS